MSFKEQFSLWLRKGKLPVLFVIIVVVGYLFWQLVLAGGSFVPDSFLKANQQGAIIASQIVQLATDSKDVLRQINDLDRQGKYEQAIELVQLEMKRNERVREKAYELSVWLGQMAENLDDIEPKRATEPALRAINFETSLIIRLLSYNANLQQLLVALDNKFTGQEVEVSEVDRLISVLNEEVVAINNINKDYLKAVDEFERLTR